MSKVLKYIEPILGKVQYYSFFKKLYVLSARALNFGRGWVLETDGEINFIKMLEKYYQKNNLSPIVFDVGANIGDYTLVFQRIFKGRARVYSFEPSKTTFNQLKLNIENAKLQGIKIYNIGFSDRNEDLTLFRDKNLSATASVYDQSMFIKGRSGVEAETIKCETLDSFCEKTGIGIIDFLKIDVEGHDLSVLNGAYKLFKERKVQIIQFEFGQCNISSRTFLRDYFEFFGSEYYIFQVLKNGLYRIDYDVIYEVFNVTNYVAIKKEFVLCKNRIVKVL